MVRNAQGLVNAWPEREFQSWGNEHGFSSDRRDNLGKSQFRALLRGCLPIALSFILSYHLPSLHCNLSLSLERKQKKIRSFISRLTISMDINRRDSPEHRKMVMPSHSLTQGRFFLQSHSIPCSGVRIFLFSASYRMPNRKKLSATRSHSKKWNENEWMNPCIQLPLLEQLQSSYVSVSLPEGITPFSAQMKGELEETKISKNSLLRVLF